MYESPINLVMQDIERRMFQEATEQTEQAILNAIRKCGVYVDKEEFIKAMTYDRNQYSKGYKDGVTDVLDMIRAEIIQIPTISFNANDIYKADVLAIIDKYMANMAESEG